MQASFGAFAAILSDASVVAWGDAKFGGDSSTVQDRLRNGARVRHSTGNHRIANSS